LWVNLIHYALYDTLRAKEVGEDDLAEIARCMRQVPHGWPVLQRKPALVGPVHVTRLRRELTRLFVEPLHLRLIEPH